MNYTKLKNGNHSLLTDSFSIKKARNKFKKKFGKKYVIDEVAWNGTYNEDGTKTYMIEYHDRKR